MLSTLFDKGRRTGTASPEPADSTFTYLNRSARPEAARIRRQLDRWLRFYPVEHADELARRFRVPRETEQAFFELLNHELLRQLGLTVSVVPRGVSKTPDFLVSSGRTSCYWECTTTAAEFEANRNERNFSQAVRSIEESRWLVTLAFDGELKQSIGVNQLRTEVRRWLQTMDPDDPSTSTDSRLIWHFGKATIIAEAMGLPRANPAGTVLISESRGGIVSARTRFLSALRSKMEYEDLKYPLVVALGSRGSTGSFYSFEEALLGRNAAFRHPETKDLLATRQPNGLWHGPTGLRSRRIAAAVFFEFVTPWSMNESSVRLYRHPGIRFRLPRGLRNISTWPNRSALGYANLTPLRDLVGLPPRFPRGS